MLRLMRTASSHLDGALVFFLCAFASALSFSVSLSELMLCGALAVKCLMAIRDGSFKKNCLLIKNHPLVAPWLGYLAAALLCCLFGINPMRSLAHLNSDVIKAAACLFLAVFFPGGKNGRLITLFYVIGALLSCAWALSKFSSGLAHLGATEFIIAGASRTTSTINPITFGTVLSFTFFLLAAQVMCHKEPPGQKARIAALLFAGLTLLLNQSYGVYLGCAVALMLLLIFASSGKLKILLLLALLAAIVAPAATLKKSNRFSALPEQTVHLYRKALHMPDTTGEAKTAASIAMRLELWQSGKAIIRDYPLFGVGLANVRTVFDYYHPAPFLIEHKKVFGFGNLHNLYLHQAAERGLLGLAALLWLMFALLRYAWQTYKKAPGATTLWALCMLPGFYVMNVSETSFQHALPALSMCLMLGAASAREH